MTDSLKNIEPLDYAEMFSASKGEGKFYRALLDRMEKPLFDWVLKKTEGNQIKAARILGINRNTFRTRLRKLGINPKAYRQNYE